MSKNSPVELSLSGMSQLDDADQAFIERLSRLLDYDETSPNAEQLRAVVFDRVVHYLQSHQANVSIQPDSDSSKKFKQLESEWIEATETVSSISRICSHPAYLKIIAMGTFVVPLILKSLQERPYHWFPALSAITNANPVVPGSTFDAAVTAWLDWGRAAGLID